MKTYLTALMGIAFWASFVKAGQIISTYNLIAPQQLIVPHPYSSLTVGHPQVISTLPHHGTVPAHPKVVQTSIEESVLPQQLSKSNNFYGNPFIASALARESLNLNKEAPVYDRPSERIPRYEIVKLINNLKRVHYDTR